MQSTEGLISDVRDYIRQVDGSQVQTDEELIRLLMKFLIAKKYEVMEQMQLPSLEDGKNGENPQRVFSDLVVKIGKEYVPIEIKLNGKIQEYKRYITQIQRYVSNYQDVPCSLVMFLAQRSLKDDDVYNLTWQRCVANNDYQYILARYAAYREDQRVFVRKSINARPISPSWRRARTKVSSK